MTSTEFQLQTIGDPRLTPYAPAALPVWGWSVDGLGMRWATPVAAQLFGAANGTALSRKSFGPADPHRRQVAQLANGLPMTGAVRMERLRGLGAQAGMLMTCACARLDF